MLPSLDNFVSYGTDVFKARADYRQMVLDIYTIAVTSEHLGENDAVNGCKLAESMLLNLRGHIDEVCYVLILYYNISSHSYMKHLQSIITTSFKILDTAQTGALKLANLEVLINTVLYNPAAALHFMETIRAGASRVFFDKWFEAINSDERLPRVHDKKLTIMALCALLEMDPSAVPVAVQDVWSNIVAGALHVFKAFPRAVEGT